MEIIITESQKKTLQLIKEGNKINSLINSMKDVTDSAVSQANQQFKFDLKILTTFSAGIGGVIGPINEFIHGEFPHLEESNVLLIGLAVSMIIVTDYSDSVKKLLSEIVKLGLTKEFKKTLKVGNDLKNSFLDFMQSLNLTFHRVTSIMSFAFLIPILDILVNLSQGTEGESSSQIAARILSFLAVGGSGIFLKEVLTKIIDRFRSN
jgi:hypothetical protein